MDTFAAIEQRRSVKRFDPEHEMTQEEIQKLLSLTLLSPTAFNIQHWRMVVVEDKALRQQIQEVSWNQAQVTEASLLVVFCADKKSWAKDADRYWKDAPEPVRNFLVPAIGQYYEGREMEERDECMRSCGIAAQTMMLASKAMGYDSCPMDGFDFDAVAKMINLPDDHLISMFVVVGKALAPANVRGGQLPYEEVILKDRFPG